MEDNKPVHPVFLDVEDILDQAAFEKVGLPVGDDKEIDLEHLIAQGRIKRNEI